MREVSVEIDLDEETLGSLKKLSERTGMSIEEIVAIQVRAYIRDNHRVPDCVMEKRFQFGADSMEFFGAKDGVEVYAPVYDKEDDNPPKYLT